MQLTSNISLIGFMGTGKTTIGKMLASALNKKYLEMDEFIEEKIGQPLSEYLPHNEFMFRRLESRFCQNLRKVTNTVISCGGGVVIQPANIQVLRTYTWVVLLTASPKQIKERVLKEGLEKRPLLTKDNLDQKIDLLLKKRNSLYMNAAHFVVETDNKSPNRIVSEIISKMEA